MRQNVAKPANGAGDGDDRSEHADGFARNQSRKQQRDSERKDNRPRRWRRHLDRVRRVSRRFGSTNSTAILFLSSAPDNVYDDENHHPHHIHEVPIHRQNLDAFGVLLSYMPKEREDRHRRKSKQADRYVKRMQADQ